MLDETWRSDAICDDTDFFYPVGETGPAEQQIEAAKAICAQCPAQTACLEYAISIREWEGIWGGTTGDERRNFIRRRRRSAQRAAAAAQAGQEALVFA